MKNLYKLLLLIFFCSTCLGEKSLTINERQLFDFIDDVALSYTVSRLPGGYKKMWKKNPGELKIFLDGNWNGNAAFIFKKAAQDIGYLADLNVSVVHEAKDCNLHVGMGFDSIKDVYKDFKKGYNPSLWEYDAAIKLDLKTLHISKCLGFISERHINNNALLEYFSYRILIVSLGFTGLSNTYDGSIFCSPFLSCKPPSNLDRLCIKLMYSDNIKPKMKITDIKKVVRHFELLDLVNDL